jgi:hypothetical protein
MLVSMSRQHQPVVFGAKSVFLQIHPCGKLFLVAEAGKRNFYMSYQWGLDLVSALGFEQQFAAAQTVALSDHEARLLRPTFSESARAVANIRAWRSYLPEACVSRMIEDGWPWST